MRVLQCSTEHSKQTQRTTYSPFLFSHVLFLSTALDIYRTPQTCLHNFMVFCYMEPPKSSKDPQKCYMDLLWAWRIWRSWHRIPWAGVRRTFSTWRIQVATCHAKEVISSWRALRSGMPRWPHVFLKTISSMAYRFIIYYGLFSPVTHPSRPSACCWPADLCPGFLGHFWDGPWAKLM